jgi:hypothetical protein
MASATARGLGARPGIKGREEFFQILDRDTSAGTGSRHGGNVCFAQTEIVHPGTHSW